MLRAAGEHSGRMTLEKTEVQMSVKPHSKTAQHQIRNNRNQAENVPAMFIQHLLRRGFSRAPCIGEVNSEGIASVVAYKILKGEPRVGSKPIR